MTMILKVIHDLGQPVDIDSACDIHGDILSCRFYHCPDGAMATITRREPAQGPGGLIGGFVEREDHIVIGAEAYLMNEHGKTVSTFRNSGLGRLQRQAA